MSTERPGRNEIIGGEFDAVAPDYEDNRLAGWYKAQAEEVLDAIGVPAEGTILDVGCGTGWLLRQAQAAHAHVDGLGVDLSPAMIERAKELAAVEGRRALRFVNADWETLDVTALEEGLDGRPVRTAVCVSAFHYFEDPLQATRKIFDCLSPGGRLFVLERAKDGSALTRIWDLLHRTLIKDQVRFYASAELLGIVRNAGFVDARILSRTTRYFWKGKLYTSLTLVSAQKPEAAAAGEGA